MPKLPKIIFSLQYLKEELSDEVDFLHADKHKSLLQIDSMILIGMAKHSQSFQNRKFVMSLQYVKKEVKDEVDFMAKHSQSFQNRKFVMSLQYVKKEVKDEVDFLHADKHQSLPKVYFSTLDIKVSYKVDIISINGHDQAFSNYSK